MSLRYNAYPVQLAKQIPVRFLDFRLRNFMTQKELGKYIGLSRWSITEIENANQLPHWRTWKRFLALEDQEKNGGRFSIVRDENEQKPLQQKPRRRKKLPTMA
jgi:DNA-binding XRE family transcriptional regulator